MKNFIIFLQLFCVMSFFSCEKDEVRAIIDEDVPPPTLISPTNNYTKVIEEQDASELITFVWESVNYGIATPVSYTIAIDSATRNFAGAINLGSSDNNAFSITIGEFNEILINDLGITPNEAASIEVKVTSQLAASDEILESDPITLIITPWASDEPDPLPEYPALWVAGDFQGWNIGTAPRIVSVNDDGKYLGYIYIPEGGTNEFKLYAQADWAPLSYGDGGEGTIIVHNDVGNNFVAPSSGYYHLAVDVNEMTYLLMKIETWGIIGDATPGGWDSSTEMIFDPDSQTWSVTADLTVGQFKIRANDEWVIDLGMAEEGYLRYENHPWLPYEEGARPTISEEGNYTITMDLSEPGIYTYSIQKN